MALKPPRGGSDCFRVSDWEGDGDVERKRRAAKDCRRLETTKGGRGDARVSDWEADGAAERKRSRGDEREEGELGVSGRGKRHRRHREDSEEEEGEDEGERVEIQEQTGTDLVNLRKAIYLTIMSSVDFEEAGHKLLKIHLVPGEEVELCTMLLECCSQERTYLRYHGLLGERLCRIDEVHQANFEACFVQQYSMVHRLETSKLRNVARFFAHLLGTFALPWRVLSCIRLTEEDTTSSSRIFIKILLQELSEHLGIALLTERLEPFFPRDSPRNTRFAINFCTAIGLGGVTENLREYLKTMPRLMMQQQKEASEEEEESGSGSESSGSESARSESEYLTGRDGGRRRRSVRA